MVGELYIGGAGLARGYLNQSKLTQNSFITHPFSTKEDRENGYLRLYKTGDLARWLQSGDLEYIGRHDFQVKLRGYRIELSEIENVMANYDGIRQNVTLLKEREENKYLVCYYVADRKILISDLREYAEKHLPNYMVPSVWVYLTKLPMTIHGKIDRRLLPEPDAIKEIAYAAPKKEIEKQLCQLWQEILGIKKVGIHDDFFSLGGDSILSIQMVAKARKLGLTFNIANLFQVKTIANLARLIQQENLPSTVLHEKEVKGSFNLTPIQHWFFDLSLANPHYFNQSFVITFTQINPKQLKEALQYLINHHDAFKMRFQKVGQKWEGYYKLKTEQLNYHYYKAKTSEEIVKLCNQASAKFNIQEGPLYQFFLFKLREGHFCLYALIHHLIVDGISWRILREDLHALYHQARSHEPLNLPYKSSSYQLWSRQLAIYANDSLTQAKLDYWTNFELNANALALKPRKDSISTPTHHLFAELSPQASKILIEEAATYFDVKLNSILIFPLILALFEFFQKHQLMINMESHGRSAQVHGVDVSETIGWFTNIYPCLIELPSDFNGEIGFLIRHIDNQLRQVPDEGLPYFTALYNSTDFNILKQLKSLWSNIAFNYLGKIGQSERDWNLKIDARIQNIASVNPLNSLLALNSLCENGIYKLIFSFQGIEKNEAKKIFDSLLKIQENLTEAVGRGPVSYREKFKNGFEPIIKVNPYGKKKPLWLVHTFSSGAEVYLNNIVKRLNPQRPLFLFDHYILRSDQHDVHNIEELARKYVTFLKQEQPFGPYNLFGWSFGAVVAYQMAQYLAEEGEKIEIYS